VAAGPASRHSAISAGSEVGIPDPSSVYLYRREPRELAEKLGIDARNTRARQFQSPMYNKDVIFVANSQSVDVTKFFNFLNVVTATANSAVSTGVEVESWRVLSHTR
jgi:polysaccharide biosynthesis/export protein